EPEPVDQAEEARVEVRDDREPETARAERGEGGRDVGKDAPRLRSGEVRPERVEGGVERGRIGVAERLPHDGVPPGALVSGELRGARAGEGEGRRRDEGRAEPPLDVGRVRADAVARREARVRPPDRLGDREERPRPVERDGREGHQGLRGRARSDPWRKWSSTPQASRGRTNAVGRPSPSRPSRTRTPDASSWATSRASGSTSIAR